MRTRPKKLSLRSQRSGKSGLQSHQWAWELLLPMPQLQKMQWRRQVKGQSKRYVIGCMKWLQITSLHSEQNSLTMIYRYVLGLIDGPVLLIVRQEWAKLSQYKWLPFSRSQYIKKCQRYAAKPTIRV